MRFIVRGNSMSPTFNEGDRLFVSSFILKLSKPRVEDVVVVKDPRNNRMLLKRIKKIVSGSYFVQGDNEKASTDSRAFGLIKIDKIVGKVLFRYSRGILS